MAFVLMKLFEESPRRFDRLMNLLTGGRLGQIRGQILTQMIGADMRILEVGCGTGALLERMAMRGARVVGIDVAEKMAEAARGRLSAAGLTPRAEARRLHALEIEDAFAPESFDRVVSILALSEMSDDEIDALLPQCRRVLRRGGRLILVDETVPAGFFARQLYRVYREVMRLATFLGLQAAELVKANLFFKVLYFVIELPLMLLTFFVVPPATHPLENVERRIEAAGFRLLRSEAFLGGSLKLLYAEAVARRAPEGPDPLAKAERYVEPRSFWPSLRELPRRTFQTVFRSVPFPTRPRLIALGQPGRDAPVLLTSNYDGTLRRACRALSGIDAYLLVAPADGIDVWCAAGGGKLNVESIVSILKTSRIAGRVDHRRLILPQLSANGLNLFEVRRRTGWSAVFGPVDVADVPEYLERGRRSEKMMRVTFPARERLEMAIAMWGSLSLRYSIFPALVLGLAAVPWFVAGLAVMAVLLSLGGFAIPGQTFVQKAGAAFCLPGSALIAGGEWLATGSLSLLSVSGIALLFFAAYLVGSAYAGYTPLRQCGYSTLFFGFPRLRLGVRDEACTGCKLCEQVCPLGCFSLAGDGKAVVSHPELCGGCMACLVQCPADAIVNLAEPSCA